MTTCPTCGSPVRVVSSDEGTSYYEPAPDPGAGLREALIEARPYLNASTAPNALLLRVDALLSPSAEPPETT